MLDTVTVRIPRDLRSKIERFCKKEKLPMSDLIRESIQRYIAVKQFRALRKKAMPFAESQGLLTDEDIFKTIS